MKRSGINNEVYQLFIDFEKVYDSIKRESLYDILIKFGIPNTGKRSLGRPRRRWEDNIRINLKGIGINTRNWVDSAQDRDYWRALVNATSNLRVL